MSDTEEAVITNDPDCSDIDATMVVVSTVASFTDNDDKHAVVDQGANIQCVNAAPPSIVDVKAVCSRPNKKMSRMQYMLDEIDDAELTLRKLLRDQKQLVLLYDVDKDMLKVDHISMYLPISLDHGCACVTVALRRLLRECSEHATADQMLAYQHFKTYKPPVDFDELPFDCDPISVEQLINHANSGKYPSADTLYKASRTKSYHAPPPEKHNWSDKVSNVLPLDFDNCKTLQDYQKLFSLRVPLADITRRQEDKENQQQLFARTAEGNGDNGNVVTRSLEEHIDNHGASQRSQ